MQMKSTTAAVSGLRALALFVAMMAMNIGSATAAQAKPENTDQADSAAYAEEAQCMMVIVRMRTINPNIGAVATAMLGRLPPCEVRKYIRALPRR